LRAERSNPVLSKFLDCFVASLLDDGRQVLVRLTPAGQSLIQELIPVEVACTAQTLAPLNQAKRELLYGLLHKLTEE
jgi:DNA-binding MarR family transcriptional regulator